MTEVRGLLASGVPRTAHPFTGLVYRQALELLDGVRDEPATRELIVRENRRYARRQLIWFRKEPNLQWIHAAGEREETRGAGGRTRSAARERKRRSGPASVRAPAARARRESPRESERGWGPASADIGDAA